MGAPRTRPEKILERDGDALYDFALSVTGDAERAMAAVREAVPAALETYGPDPGRGRLFGSVFAVAARDAVPAPLLGAELIEGGSGSPEELQSVARASTLFLDPVQRGCLDLALRQDLEGEALSEALGVSPGLASVSVQAATEQAEHVIGAILLARVGRADCAGLADLTLEAVGAGADKLAAAVVEHEGTCPACGDRRRALVPVTTLLATVPAVTAPPEIRRRLDPRRRGGVRALRPPAPAGSASGSYPSAGRPRRRGRRAVVAGLAGLVVVVAAVAGLWPRRSGEIGRTAAPGGQLAVDTTPVDFGPAAVQGEVRITNSGREPLVFETRAAVPWISFVGGEGTLDPGATAVVSAVLDRSRAPEGAADSEIRVQTNGGSAVVPVHAIVERAPELSGLEITPQTVVVRRCPGSTPAQVRAAVVEESGLGAVELHWKGPGQAEQGRAEEISPMSGEDAAYMGALGPFEVPGDVQWWVSAVDIRNNRASSAPQVLRVGSC